MLSLAKQLIKWFERNFFITFIIVLIIASFIFYMSSRTSDPTPFRFSLKPYIYHFGIFFLLAFFLSILLSKGKSKELLFIAVLLSITYGISDELHQLFVPNRACDIKDVLTDSIGILFAGIFYLSVNFKQHQKSF